MARTARPNRSHLDDQPRPHRLAVAIVRVAKCRNVVRNLADLSDGANAAGATVRMWCRTAKVHPHNVVSFTRALGALYNALRRNVGPVDLLDFAEQRSLNRFLAQSGPLVEDNRPVSASTFCVRQRFIDHNQIVADVIRLMAEEEPIRKKRD